MGRGQVPDPCPGCTHREGQPCPLLFTHHHPQPRNYAFTGPKSPGNYSYPPQTCLSLRAHVFDTFLMHTRVPKPHHCSLLHSLPSPTHLQLTSSSLPLLSCIPWEFISTKPFLLLALLLISLCTSPMEQQQTPGASRHLPQPREPGMLRWAGREPGMLRGQAGVRKSEKEENARF